MRTNRMLHCTGDRLQVLQGLLARLQRDRLEPVVRGVPNSALRTAPVTEDAVLMAVRSLADALCNRDAIKRRGRRKDLNV